MKKKSLILFLAFLFLNSYAVFSQVASYFFNQSQTTYSAITGGTVFGNTVTDDQIFINPGITLGSGANGTGVGLPIGFNFEFNYTIYDRIGVNANGWFTFGQSTLTPCVNMNSNNNFACISDTSNASFVQRTRISALCYDIQGQTGSEIRVETIGIAPNRVLVVQWTNYRKYNHTGDNFNFQIRLNETSNVVDIVYGTFINNATAATAQVGLRGVSNLDYNNRDVNSTSVWGNSQAGASYTTFVSFNQVLVPSSGLRYEWIPLPACTGIPAFNTIQPSSPLVCQGGASNLSLTNSYNNSGISYQWSSASSPGGPFLAIVNATNSAYFASGIANTTWYQCVVTCTNSSSSTTMAATNINVVATVTNSIPYFEGFEGLLVNNQLPNCSWNVSNPNTICQTYASVPAAPVYNRIPKSGSKFASFRYGANDYFYSSGLQLSTGVTYSASVWYIVDGQAGWTNFSLLYGTSQSPGNLITIAATSASTLSNQNYLPLSGTFTVPSNGIYYIALRGVGNSTPKYLSWDDLSVTAPCSLNSPNYAINPINPNVCAGKSITLTASGALTYTWSNGSNSASISVSPTTSASYSVIGTSTLGCAGSTVSSVNVLSAPSISILTNSSTICAGQNANQIAVGANSYTWSTGSTSFSISVSPTITANYTVTGINSNGCSGTAVQTIVVSPGPPILASSSSTLICSGATASLSANGGNNYQWSESVSSFSIGSSIVVSPTITTTYTLNATSLTGCPVILFVTQGVEACVGIQNTYASKDVYQVYPNPNNGQFILDMTTSANRSIELIDMTGRVIFTQLIYENKTMLSIENLANGIYYLKVKSDNSLGVVKLIKQ
jgi:hypothetical protein